MDKIRVKQIFQQYYPTAVVLPGKPSKERFFDQKQPYEYRVGWVAKSVARLALLGYQVSTPDISQPYLARYDDWANTLNSQRVDHNSSLTGFSRGASALLHWLSDQSEMRVGDVNLVSYWSDPDGKYEGSQGDFVLDEALPERCSNMRFFYDPADRPVARSLQSVPSSWRQSRHVEFIELADRGHMLPYDTDDIPELTAVIGTGPSVLE